MSTSLLEVLGLRPPRRTDLSDPQDPDSRSRERTLVSDAHRSYTDYLDVRDSAGDTEPNAAALAQAHRDLAEWRKEFGTRGAADQRERMELLATRLELEHAAFESLRLHLKAVDALIAQRDEASDARSRDEIQRQLSEAFANLPR